MAERAVFESCDFMVVCPVFARGADPGVEIKQRLTRGNAHREMSVTAGTRSHPSEHVCM